MNGSLKCSVARQNVLESMTKCEVMMYVRITDVENRNDDEKEHKKGGHRL